MWGSRNPSNILLESDCSYHESCRDDHTQHQSSRPSYLDRDSLEVNSTRDTHYHPSLGNTKRPCSTPSEAFNKNICSPRIKCDGKCIEHYPQKDNHANIIQTGDCNEQFIKEVPNATYSNGATLGEYQKQFRQGIAENVHTKGGRGTNVDGYSCQDVENARCKNIEIRCSREKPQDIVFSCNDCMEPQCLYCWRKLRDAKGDFSFLDGFETQEPKWKPSKRNVDQFNNHYVEPNQYNSRNLVGLEDRLHLETPNLKPNTCQSSCFLEEPKWKPTNSIHANHEDLEPIQHPNKRCDPPLREHGWQWPLGKGRGMGPVPGEWIPPFRKHSLEYPFPSFQRSKGTGEIPNLDDWVPPFRGEEQPYNWHRCKGSGMCPPQDQWLAPWCNSIKNKSVDQACGGRGGNSCLDHPQENKTWRAETREVFETGLSNA